MCRECNGWTNYETWNVKLWFDNDVGTYDTVRDIVRDSRSEYEAGKNLREFVEEMNPLSSEASMFSDMLNAAISSVNWQEIASSYLEEIKEEETEE